MEWTLKMEGGGSIFLRDDGSYLYFEARRVDDKEGLYKVRIQGLQGTQVLGTMLPCEEGLKLSRMISRGTLGQWGCLPITKVFCDKSFVFQEEYGCAVKSRIAPKSEKYVGDFKDENGKELSKKSEKLLLMNGEGEVGEEVVKQWGIGGNVKNAESRIRVENVGIEESYFPVLENEDNFSENDGEMNGFSEEYEVGRNVSVEEKEIWLPVHQENVGYLSEGDLCRGIENEAIKNGISNKNGILREEKEGSFSIAIPYKSGEEMPLTFIFCFAHFTQISGNTYLLYHFNQYGKPVFREKV